MRRASRIEPRYRGSSRRFQRHKEADLTSAFFPACQNFHNGRNEALKFLRAPTPRVFFTTFAPFFSRENSYKRSTPPLYLLQCGRDCEELPASIFGRRFKTGRFFRTPLRAIPIVFYRVFSNEWVVKDVLHLEESVQL